MFEKIKELCKIGIKSGEALLQNIIKRKGKRNYVKGKINGYKNILKYINFLERKEKE